MAELFAYILAGAGFVFIGASEYITSTSETLRQLAHRSSPSSTTHTRSKTSSIGPFIFVAISVISVLFVFNSLFSITDALNSKDQIGVVLQLEVISISALFLLFSVLGILTNLSNSFRFPSSILNILCLFGFVEEFFLFYLQKKDPDGIENRYYDLLLVPISVCVFSTILELRSPKLVYSRSGRGVGLVLQGMWFIQMGLSFYSKLIADGCSLRGKSRGNFTIRCKGHPEFHRARAIATLQFNCHLALLVCFVAGVYAVVCKKHGLTNESMEYKPLGAEMQNMDNHSHFTLDTDDDEDDGVGGGAKDEENVMIEKSLDIVPDTKVNGYGSHR